MSYDFEVWSIHPVAGTASLPGPRDWQPNGGGWFLRQCRGDLVIWPSDKVWPEDIPEDIAIALPGIAFVTRLTASGALTKALLSRASRTAKALATVSHGIVFNPQEESLLLPPGVRRYRPVRYQQGASFPITKLSWWTLDGTLFGPQGVARFVALLEDLLAEALPRRYGLTEPPQHVYAQTGREHLIRYLGGNASNGVVWYPMRPVVEVDLNTPATAGAMALGFRTHWLSLSVETSALDQPGWDAQLRRVWRAVSKLVRPFYGDVRTLAGYFGMRGGLQSGRDSESHPVKAWWWRGVPATPASAVVIGPDYQNLWPGLLAEGTLEDGLAFLDGADWRHPAPYATPAELIQPDLPPFDPKRPLFSPAPDRGHYAELWPFGEPFRKS